MLEPLALGYIGMCTMLQLPLEDAVLKIILQTFLSANLSANLINKLNQLGKFSFSHFLMLQDEVK